MTAQELGWFGVLAMNKHDKGFQAVVYCIGMEFWSMAGLGPRRCMWTYHMSKLISEFS
jgi:hypothetical protein